MIFFPKAPHVPPPPPFASGIKSFAPDRHTILPIDAAVSQPEVARLLALLIVASFVKSLYFKMTSNLKIGLVEKFYIFCWSNCKKDM